MVKPSLVLLSVMQGHLVGPSPWSVTAATTRLGAAHRRTRIGGPAVADPVGHGLAYRACQVIDLDAAEVGGSGDVEHGAAGWAAAPLLTCAPALARPTI
ncbi:MAG: hypothetical protein QOH09_1977 [Pseudonocardiales bacterium]|jgi:hypothetical protein|nr:hypothetical protein [Pseudonocardiales bacterium]